ncbi:MAG: Bax inhibitor-1/YccA family protein [Neomegalonema sp.]|nr:Bax inhibitor-1/YccA family protein [Neomegalonema sp.]
MVDSRPSVIRTGASTQARADIHEGLRAYMGKVYGLMATAMLVSGVLAYFFGMQLDAIVDAAKAGGFTKLDAYLAALKSGAATPPSVLMLPAGLIAGMYSSPFIYVLMFAPLGLVLLLSFRIHAMSAASASGLFYVYSALVGVSIATIFVRFTDASIAQTFFATSVAFLGLSLYGYTTKTDLSGMGRFLVMALIGLIVVSLINIFLKSDMLSTIISAVGVLIFAGLTAYDTQEIKNEYLAMSQAGPEGEAYLEKGAIMGALRLYLNFLNMFLFLLQFMGAADD